MVFTSFIKFKNHKHSVLRKIVSLGVLVYYKINTIKTYSKQFLFDYVKNAILKWNTIRNAKMDFVLSMKNLPDFVKNFQTFSDSK